MAMLLDAISEAVREDQVLTAVQQLLFNFFVVFIFSGSDSYIFSDALSGRRKKTNANLIYDPSMTPVSLSSSWIQLFYWTR
jgi:hypothetical protein